MYALRVRQIGEQRSVKASAVTVVLLCHSRPTT